MWNNMKGMPDNYEALVTSLYEFEKNIGEYMTSEGDCLATLEVGRFILYLDLVGEASFQYRGKMYRNSEEITTTLRKLIREGSPKIEWIGKPELRLYLQMGNDSYSGFEITIDYEKLPNKLAIEVMMCRMLVDSLLLIEREKVVSDKGEVGVMHLLTEEENRYLNMFKHCKQLTKQLPPGTSPTGATNIVYDKIASQPDLANAVSMLNVYTEYTVENEVELTVSWNSDNHVVDNEMRQIAGVWA